MITEEWDDMAKTYHAFYEKPKDLKVGTYYLVDGCSCYVEQSRIKVSVPYYSRMQFDYLKFKKKLMERIKNDNGYF